MPFFLFSLTALTGAFLLFLVEPMFARMVLPLLGGAPAVWNTCLVFYQLALLAGYLYAHVIGRRPARQQVAAQIAIMVLAGALLPISIRDAGSAPPTASPIAWVFPVLLTSIGLPFVVLATTGPLLQRWYSLLGNRGGTSPYSLFAASNAGSFVALLGYPFLIEPLLRLRTQSLTWSAGYGLYALLIAACGVIVWRAAPAGTALPTVPDLVAPERTRRSRRGAPPAPEPDDWWAARLRWLGLAAIPSSLMMSVTTFISTDVGSVPLLWVVPLALYLLTFVLAFAGRPLMPRRALAWLFPMAVVLIVALVIAPPVYPVTMIVLHLSAFFVVALACHLELAGSRPPAETLTEFYLWLSAGGAVGGIFNALIAPIIFVNPFEYPLAALSACLLLPNALGASAGSSRSRVRQIASLAWVGVPVLLLAALVAFVQRFDARLPPDAFTRYAIIFIPPCVAAVALLRAPLRMGVALATIVVAGAFVRFDSRVPIHLERSFFGVHRVLFSGRERVLLSGTTNHGAQSIDPALRCEPLTYYSRKGPVGQLLAAAVERGKTRFGVVGLGTASLAAYARPGQQWTFFEINPAVERIARDPEYFTYLRDCAPEARVVTGDARLMLVNEGDGAFDVLLLDAFSSDAIPVHLMTEEAFDLYFRKLAPGGLLAVHVSNRYLDLAPVVGATAGRAGLTSVVQLHSPSTDQRAISNEISPSRWVVVARGRADLGQLAGDTRWQPLDGADGPVWTDDYSNVLSVLRR